MSAIALPPTWGIIMNAASIQASSPSFAPTPHARKKPNLTMSMLEALKVGFDSADGHVSGDRGVKKALVCRNLSEWHYDGQGNENSAYITENGRLLIEHQYEALKKVLPETRSAFK